MIISYEGTTNVMEQAEACRLELAKLREEARAASEAAYVAKEAENKPKIEALEAELNKLESTKQSTFKVIIA